MPAGQLYGGSLHPVLSENGGGVGRHARNDQRHIIPLDSADSGIRGGVTVTERQIHFAPKTSFPVRRCPRAKSSAETRLRPSSCTSSSSSILPLPHPASTPRPATSSPGLNSAPRPLTLDFQIWSVWP